MSWQADKKMDIVIGHMLRTGVTIAAVVVLTGWMLMVTRVTGPAPGYHHFHGVPAPVLKIAPVLDGVRQLQSASIIQLGILLLVLTPIFRVVFCVFGFAAKRDPLYVTVSAVVLTILVYSLVRG